MVLKLKALWQSQVMDIFMYALAKRELKSREVLIII